LWLPRVQVTGKRRQQDADVALPFCYGTVAFWLGKKVRRTVCIWHLSWCFDLPLKVEGGRWWRSLPLTQSHMCIGMRTLSIGCCGGSARSGVEAQRGEQSPRVS
jgi:hypothetical protein